MLPKYVSVAILQIAKNEGGYTVWFTIKGIRLS